MAMVAGMSKTAAMKDGDQNKSRHETPENQKASAGKNVPPQRSRRSIVAIACHERNLKLFVLHVDDINGRGNTVVRCLKRGFDQNKRLVSVAGV